MKGEGSGGCSAGRLLLLWIRLCGALARPCVHGESVHNSNHAQPRNTENGTTNIQLQHLKPLLIHAGSSTIKDPFPNLVKIPSRRRDQGKVRCAQQAPGKLEADTSRCWGDERPGGHGCVEAVYIVYRAFDIFTFACAWNSGYVYTSRHTRYVALTIHVMPLSIWMTPALRALDMVCMLCPPFKKSSSRRIYVL